MTHPYMKGFLGAFTAIVIVVFGYHVWRDHQSLHAVIGVINTLAEKHSDLFK